MNKYTLIFFGIRKYGAIVLGNLIKSDRFNIIKVYTKYDDFNFSPRCEEICKSNDIEYEFVSKINSEIVSEIININADIILTSWFHLKIPQSILNSANISPVNFHPSLLPKYRGPNPVEWAIANGETEAGLTAHIMTEQFDAGPIIDSAKVSILDTDNSDDVSVKIAQSSSILINKILNKLQNNSFITYHQNEDEASYFPRRTIDNSYIDWTKPAKSIYNKIRGYNPYPFCRTVIDNKTFIVKEAEIVENMDCSYKIIMKAGDGLFIKFTNYDII